jgi:hypothetical protein
MDFLNEPCDIDTAPTICVEDGKTNDIRFVVFDYIPDVRVCAAPVVGIENVNRVAVRAEHGTHEIEAHGDGADIFFIDAVVYKLWVDE